MSGRKTGGRAVRAVSGRLAHVQANVIAVLMRRLDTRTLVIGAAEMDAAEAAIDIDVSRDEAGDLACITVTTSRLPEPRS